jgi:hypothetical protein
VRELIEDPNEMKSRILRLLPMRAIPYTLNEEPRRAMLRKETTEPMVMKSRIEKELPSRLIPNRLKELPKRAN